MFAARDVLWANGGLNIIEHVIDYGDAPLNFMRFHAPLQVQIGVAPNGQAIVSQKMVEVPALNPLAALQWLAANIQRLVKEITTEGQQQMMKKQIVLPGAVNGKGRI